MYSNLLFILQLLKIIYKWKRFVNICFRTWCKMFLVWIWLPQRMHCHRLQWALHGSPLTETKLFWGSLLSCELITHIAFAVANVLCLLLEGGKISGGRGQLEKEQGLGVKSNSSKSTPGRYLLVAKGRWITSSGLWQLSWDEKKKGPGKCMQPSPIIPLITCNIVAGYFCHTESDWWSQL